MDVEYWWTALKKSLMFQHLTDEQIYFILETSEEIHFSAGEYIIREGEKGNEVYLVIEGRMEISKRDESTGVQHHIHTMGIGETFGEQTLIDKSPRSASVKALENSKVLALNLLKLSQLPEQKPLFAQLIINIAGKLSERLRKTSELTVKTLQAKLKAEEDRLEAGRFLFLMLFLLSAWVFIIAEMKNLTASAKMTSFITFPMIIILITVAIIHAKISSYPLSFFGLNFNNWKKNALEGVLYSIPLLVFTTLLKWLFILYVPRFQHESVIVWHLYKGRHVSPFLEIIMASLYILLTPLQEFVARGTLQSSIRNFLIEFRSPVWAIILSNTIFAAFHAHISGWYALGAFIGGCVWGWLYARQRSLVGPIVSHALVGLWCILILQYDLIFRAL